MADEANGAGTPTILIVDDSPDNISLIHSLLQSSYRTKIATDGETALRLMSNGSLPDLVLLDVVMPGLDGHEVCRRLKKDRRTAEVPIIFLTARSDVDDEKTGLELGAVDYITKPINPAIVSARVRTHLQLKSARDFLRSKSEFLEQEVQRRTREISAIQDATMVAMGSLAETRDNETGNHIRRTQHYLRALAARMKDHSGYADVLSPETIGLLYKSAPLHDIGKVGIPDSILLKPGKLTAEEFEIMKTHTTLGRNAIIAAENLLDSPTSFLHFAREIAWTHHEWWNGTGYPQGLSGEDIPVPGRLMAVVDVYDALLSRRVYKPAIPHETALGMIKEQAGTHFDPEMVEAFLKIAGDLPEIARRFAEAA
jgi:putative two-component system response regulator